MNSTEPVSGELTPIGERASALMTLARRVWKVDGEVDVAVSVLMAAKANLAACEESLACDVNAAEQRYAEAAANIRKAGELLMMLSRARLVRAASEVDSLL